MMSDTQNPKYPTEDRFSQSLNLLPPSPWKSTENKRDWSGDKKRTIACGRRSGSRGLGLSHGKNERENNQNKDRSLGTLHHNFLSLIFFVPFSLWWNGWISTASHTLSLKRKDRCPERERERGGGEQCCTPIIRWFASKRKRQRRRWRWEGAMFIEGEEQCVAYFYGEATKI